MKEKNFGRVLKVIVAALCAVGVLMTAVLVVSAWYVSITHRLTRTDELDIDIPPIIYIKDDNLQEITSFHLDGLKTGEEYNAVFCVSPAVPGSVNDFFLGVIYTENLGMNISLYPVSSVTEQEIAGTPSEKREITAEDGISKTTCYFNYQKSQDGSTGAGTDGYTYKVTYGNWQNEIKPGPGNLNTGIYKAYRNLQFSETYTGSASQIDKLNDKRQFRFFILNITWTENAGMDNAKETDIVYIVSKGTRKNGTKAATE